MHELCRRHCRRNVEGHLFERVRTLCSWVIFGFTRGIHVHWVLRRGLSSCHGGYDVRGVSHGAYTVHNGRQLQHVRGLHPRQLRRLDDNVLTVCGRAVRFGNGLDLMYGVCLR